jgi:hypothetical protein
MSDAPHLEADARAIIDANLHMVLGTAEPLGAPLKRVPGTGSGAPEGLEVGPAVPPGFGPVPAETRDARLPSWCDGQQR